MPLERETIVSLGSTLSPSLQVFARLGKLLEDPDTDLADIVELVQFDPSLTFKILRLANSVMFGLNSHCDSLEEAVSRVGAREIHRIVGLAASHQSYQGDLTSYGLSAEQLWENSVATAAAMESIAHRTGIDPRGAYAAGLLRNVGRVIIDKIKGGSRYPGETVQPSVSDWERKVYGLSAVEVSALLLDHWRFPMELVNTVKLHLDPMYTAVPLADACQLNLAAHIAAQLGAGIPGESPHLALSADKCTAAGVDEEVIRICTADAQEMLEGLRGTLETLKQAA